MNLTLPAKKVARLHLALLLGYGVALALLLPATVNGDGIGYLKQVSGNDLSPGHLAYLPLLRLVAVLWPHHAPIDLALPFRLLSLLCVLASLALLYDAGRRLHGSPAAGLFGAALFGVSHAAMRAAVQVEVYAVATLTAVATLWALTRHGPSRRGAMWALAAGLFVGLAALFHLTLALLALPLLAALARRPGARVHALVGSAAAALTLVIPLGVVLVSRGLTTPDLAWTWLHSADHGIADPHGWVAPLVAVWGLARSLVFVPYPYQGSLLATVLLSVAACTAWGVLVLWSRRSARSTDRVFLAAWTAPLALFAVFFFPSDSERWIFVLPALSLALAPLGRSLTPRRSVALLLAIAALNLGLARLPAALDRRPLARARAVDLALPPGALLVSPGHGWDELVGLATTAPPERFPLVYHVGAQGGVGPALRLLHQRIDAALEARRPVFMVRLEDRTDPRGFKELAWSGLSREQLRRQLARYRITNTAVAGLQRIRRKNPPD